MATELAKAYVQIVPSADGISGSLSKALGGEADSAGKSAGSKLANAIGGALKGSIAVIGAGITAAVAGISAISKQALEAYADYEQLVGGVETLFGIGGQSLEEYAQAVGQSANEALDEWMEKTAGQRIVLNNAEEAYRTAGLSANQYMETVTSFAAALTSSLDGNTKEAALKADMAITDMSDNANKMGSSMESIQNAYNGFSKGNFTMLDNLKLGFGGTKEEMQRLLDKAGELSGVKYDISSYADIVDAIHVIQVEMGIAGTTALEASSTISGSLGMLKGSWANLIAGLGNPEADIAELANNVVESLTTVIGNVVPVIERILPGIVEGLNFLLNSIIPMIPPLIEMVLPGLLDAAVSLVQGLVVALPSILGILIDAVGEIIPLLVTIITDNLPLILETAILLITELANGISQALPELMPQITAMIIMIVTIIGQNLPLIIEASIGIIVALGKGLVESLPLIGDAILKLFDFLKTQFSIYAPILLSSAQELMRTLGQGIQDKINLVTDKARDIIRGIVDGLKSKLSEITNIGHDLIEGLWNGINDKIGWITEKIQGFGDSVISAIKNIFDIHSPSRVMRDEVGKMLAEGIWVGFEDEMNNVNRKIENAIPSQFNVGMDINGNGSNGQSGRNVTIVQNIYANETDYVGQQREAARNYRLIARTI